MAKTRNSMPSFAQGTLENLKKLYADGFITAPAFCYVTDLESMAFIDNKGEFHVILAEKVSQLESTVESLGDLNEIKDPTTGETVSVVEYINDVQKRGAAILITTEEKVVEEPSEPIVPDGDGESTDTETPDIDTPNEGESGETDTPPEPPITDGGTEEGSESEVTIPDETTGTDNTETDNTETEGTGTDVTDSVEGGV